MTHLTPNGLAVRVIKWAILCEVQAEDGRIFWIGKKLLTAIQEIAMIALQEVYLSYDNNYQTWNVYDENNNCIAHGGINWIEDWLIENSNLYIEEKQYEHSTLTIINNKPTH